MQLPGASSYVQVAEVRDHQINKQFSCNKLHNVHVSLASVVLALAWSVPRLEDVLLWCEGCGWWECRKAGPDRVLAQDSMAM